MAEIMSPSEALSISDSQKAARQYPLDHLGSL